MFGRKKTKKVEQRIETPSNLQGTEALEGQPDSAEAAVAATPAKDQADTEVEPVQNPEEAVWVRQAQQGDRAAFAKIVEAYQGPIFNLCYRMLGDRTEAEDAAQEAFIRAFLKLSSYDPARKFSSWLFSIASHYCIDRLRKRKVQLVSWDELPPSQGNPADNKPQPEAVMVAVETSQELRDLLDTLPADYRAAVILKYWHEMPYEEIAVTLDTTVSAIKSRLFRARKMMASAAKKAQERQPAASGLALAKG